jgi:[acyl-carrier-protein] S-malonyltransferase
MNPAADRLSARLQDISISVDQAARVYNVDVRRHGDAESIRRALMKQLVKPVRWTETIQSLVAEGAQAIVECGPGRVLTGLNRRIEKNKDIAMLAIEDAESLTPALAACRSDS